MHHIQHIQHIQHTHDTYNILPYRLSLHSQSASHSWPHATVYSFRYSVKKQMKWKQSIVNELVGLLLDLLIKHQTSFIIPISFYFIKTLAATKTTTLKLIFRLASCSGKGEKYNRILVKIIGTTRSFDMSRYNCKNKNNKIDLYNTNQANEQFSKLIFKFCCLLHVSILVGSASGRQLYMQYRVFHNLLDRTVCSGVM